MGGAACKGGVDAGAHVDGGCKMCLRCAGVVVVLACGASAMGICPHVIVCLHSAAAACRRFPIWSCYKAAKPCAPAPEKNNLFGWQGNVGLC